MRVVDEAPPRPLQRVLDQLDCGCGIHLNVVP
jgi:hypothetical protein